MSAPVPTALQLLMEHCCLCLPPLPTPMLHLLAQFMLLHMLPVPFTLSPMRHRLPSAVHTAMHELRGAHVHAAPLHAPLQPLPLSGRHRGGVEQG